MEPRFKLNQPIGRILGHDVKVVDIVLRYPYVGGTFVYTIACDNHCCTRPCGLQVTGTEEDILTLIGREMFYISKQKKMEKESENEKTKDMAHT